MSRKLIGRCAFVILSLGFIWANTSAEPAKAAFSCPAPCTTGAGIIADAKGATYTPDKPPAPGVCYNYFQDNTGQQWQLLSPVYYYLRDSTYASIPPAFTILRNVTKTTTLDVTDGGFANVSDVNYYSITIAACSLPPY